MGDRATISITGTEIYNTIHGIRFALSVSNNNTADIDNSSLLLNKCIISNNQSEGVDSNVPTTIINSFIFKNRRNGLNLQYDTNSRVLNSTIADNTQTGIVSYSGLSVTNSIIWGNNRSLTILNYPNVSFSNIQGYIDGTGNIEMDPLFVGGDDYHLTIFSPCIDAGTYIQDANDEDIDDHVRPQCNRFDIGADEYPGCGLIVEEEEEDPNIDADGDGGGGGGGGCFIESLSFK